MSKLNLPFVNGPAYRTTLFCTLMFTLYTTFDARLLQGKGVFEALLYAISTTPLIGLFWHVMLGVFSRLKTKHSLFAASVIVLIGCIGIFFLSSLQNQISLSGQNALEEYGKEIALNHEKVLQRAVQDAVVLQDLLPVLKQQSKLYRDRRDSEFEEGSYTGVPGTGDVEKALLGISGQLADLATNIEGDLGRVNTLNVRANAALEKMRDAAREDAEHEKRMAKLTQAGDEFRSIITAMNSSGQAVSVKFTIGNLAGELNLRSTFSKNRLTADRQKAAIARVRGELQETTSALAPYIERILAIEKIEPPMIARINAQQAVLLYAHKFIPQWLVAIGIDLWPGALLAIGMVYVMTRGIFGTIADQTSLSDAVEIAKTLDAVEDELNERRSSPVVRGQITRHGNLDEELPLAPPEHDGKNPTRPQRTKTKIYKPEELNDED